MNTKSLIWIGVFVGGTIGGAIPTLWGASFFGISSVIGNMFGGLAGIWAGYRLGQMF